MKNKTVIIDSSSVDIDFNIQETTASFIGVERGALKLAASGVRMALAIGDFDSVNQEELKRIKTLTNVIKLPSDKKKSDMESAIDLARNYGFDKIYILADMGRLDQLLINIELVKKYDLILYTPNAFFTKVNKNKKNFLIKKHGYKYITFIPLTQKVKVKTSATLKYPLPSIMQSKDTTTYLSNEIKGTELNLLVSEGELLVIQSREPSYSRKQIF